MIWNKDTYFDKRSAHERVRGKGIAPWYREMTDEQLLQRLQELKDFLSCEDHIPVRHLTAQGFGYSKCKCGAYKWDSERSWNEMPRDDREKYEEEIFTLTRYFEELGGVYSI